VRLKRPSRSCKTYRGKRIGRQWRHSETRSRTQAQASSTRQACGQILNLRTWPRTTVASKLSLDGRRASDQIHVKRSNVPAYCINLLKRTNPFHSTAFQVYCTTFAKREIRAYVPPFCILKGTSLHTK